MSEQPSASADTRQILESDVEHMRMMVDGLYSAYSNKNLNHVLMVYHRLREIVGRLDAQDDG